MAKTVLVKLDPVGSNSTGGIVEKVWVKADTYAPSNRAPWEDYRNDSNYKIIENVSDDVMVGWVLQDKTNILHNPNL